MSLIVLIVAALSGVFMAIQGSLNTTLGKSIGLLAGTFMVHITGSIFALLLLVFGVEEGRWDMLGKVPWYAYLGGLIGVGIVYGVTVSISEVGVATATTAIIVGQVSMACVVDHFGLFGLKAIPFSLWKGVGIVLMAVSAWLLLRR